MKNIITAVIMSMMLVALTACGGGGGGGGTGDSGSSGGSGSGSSTSAQNSPQAIKEVAKGIYDARAANEDLIPYISGVMEAFEVPTLGDSDLATADARLSQGLPLFSTTEAARLADAYNDNSLVTVDAFVDGLNEQGVTLRAPYNYNGTFVTKDALALLFVQFAYADPDANGVPYESGDVLPALVHALGQERANRVSPTSVDPVWGDGYLDPLQFTLLLYSIMSSDPNAVPAPAAMKTISIARGAVGTFVQNRVRSTVGSKVGQYVEVPMGAKDGAQVSVCASLLLYGHKVTVTNTPREIWHGPNTPNVTVVKMTLEFMDDYYNNYLSIDRWMLEKLGNCVLPHQGPIPGKPIEWSVSSSLEGHGNYDVTPAETDVNGEAVASWRAIHDTIPQGCNISWNQRQAVGATEVRVGSLVPGWSTLEKIVGFLKDTGNTGDASLYVDYYDWSQDPNCHPQ